MRCLQAWQLAGSDGGAEFGENTLAHDDDQLFQAHSCGGELVCSNVLVPDDTHSRTGDRDQLLLTCVW